MEKQYGVLFFSQSAQSGTVAEWQRSTSEEVCEADGQVPSSAPNKTVWTARSVLFFIKL